MNKFFIFVALALLGLFPVPHHAVQSLSVKSSRPPYVSNQVLVKLRAGHSSPVEIGDVADHVFPSHASYTRLLAAGGSGGIYLVATDGEASVEEAVASASLDPRVEYAEPNYLYYPADTVPNDPSFNQMWDMLNSGSGGKPGADIDAPRAWDLTTGSDNIVVAITDEGVDLSHPDLAPNAWVNPNEIPGNGVDDDGNGFIDDINGWNFFSNNNKVYEPATDDVHGTHVAGTLGAVGNNGLFVAGVAWHVKLMALKFIGINSNGVASGSTADAIKAIDYAIDQRTRAHVNVRVINASWAGSKPAMALHDAISAAGDAGILFVCAAANFGIDNDDPSLAWYPAGFSDIGSLIAVAATDRSDNLASTSDFGHSSVSVGAPGISILSTFPNGSQGVLSGTSMATPHVAGIAVLIWSREPDLTPAQVKQRIINTAQPVISLASKVTSSGRVDAYNAITNTVASPDFPAIRAVSANKKILTIDGVGFLNASSVVEINGVSAPETEYDNSYGLANGTVTRVTSRLGKVLMRTLVPLGTPVTITVFNPGTGQRSAPFQFTRG